MTNLNPQLPSAQNAIDLIEGIATTKSPKHAAFFVGPNMVLTLAGARMTGDGVFYHPRQTTVKDWSTLISEGLTQIKSLSTSPIFTDIQIDSIAHSDISNVIFNLYNIQGFFNTLPYYSFLKPDHYLPLTRSPFPAQEAYLHYLDSLSELPELKTYSQEQIMDIAYGTYLGYPEQAILESVKSWDQDTSDEVKAKIKNADYYSCPQPIYTYPEWLATNPSITQHEKLWSDILTDFYNSNLHKRLLADSEFTAMITELGKY